MSAASFDGWIPAIVRVGEDGIPVADWYWRGRARFDGTAFADMVQQSMARPFNQLFARTTTLDELEAIADAADVLPVAGFVAHESRCGSTLIGRMLAATGRVRVVNEAGPVDALLRSPVRDGVDDQTTSRRLQAMLRILARRTDARETACVFKFDAWQTASLDLFERAMPGTPWIFVYRDPVEVMVSHARLPSYLMAIANSRATLGIDITEAYRIPPAEYAARVLASFCEAAIARGADASRLVEYPELPEAVEKRIAPAFGLTLDEADRIAMRGAAEMHAKRPGERYATDSEGKRAEATPEIRDAAARFLAPVYERLCALRRG